MMAADSKQNLKQLRVDNWAVFFLQRLQLLFAKGDHCDLTLKFVTGQELKVHRLVLSTSTSFFESLECKGNVIQLPESLPYNVVQPIINFLYSGRLEFKAELYAELLAIAKIMKLAILARILIAQKNENGIGDKPSGKLLDVKKLQNKPSPAKTPNQASYVNILAGKKLPIWKKRTVPYKIERKPMKIEEPKPTRFEWPDEQSCNNFMMASPSFTSLSYESAPVISPPAPPPSSSPVPHTSTPLKRRVVPPISDIPDKIFKADGNATVLLTSDEKKPEDGTPPVANVSDDDDDDDGHFETIHTYGDSDDDFDAPMETDTPVSSSLKPILKPMTETPLTTPSKKVRFSFTPEDKENKIVKATENVETPPAKSVEKITDISKKTEKIIQEVLKKYPDLVKNNKNIKLKITAPGSPQQNTIMIDTKKRIVPGKSSYIVLKPAGKTDPLNSSSNEDSEKQTKTPTSNTETTKGPWKCESCVSGKNPLKFDSFVEFRKHMQEKHLEKVDPRVCEFCGYKATKRNLHLYHLYTKHGVDPPKNVKFPKCSQCSYIALSESLLIKHLNTHQQAKDLTCLVCNSTFRTHSSLHLHSLSCKPNIGARSYPCQNCEKIFKTNVSLNAHTKVCSSNKVDEDEGGGGGSAETTDNVIEVPIIETVDMEKGEHALVQIPSGIILTESPNVALIPTSESETLNNVASDITTSIGLTVAIPQEHQQAVILLDGNSQFFLQSNESVVVSNESDVEEYIVPELLRDEMGQIYTTQNVPYTVTSTGVIACPVLPIQQNKNEVGKDKGKDNRTVSDRNKTFSDGELMDTSEDNNRESFLDSAETHLESSNTRVEIKDSQDHQAEILDDVVQLQKVLQSPEPPESTEEIHLNDNDNSEAEVEKSQSNIDKSSTPDKEVEKVTEELNIEQQNQEESNIEQQKREDTNLEEQNKEASNVEEQNKEELNVEEQNKEELNVDVPKQPETNEKELNKEESSKGEVNDEESIVEEVNHAESKVEEESNHEELNVEEVNEEELNLEESIQEKLNVEEKDESELNVEEPNQEEFNVEELNEEESNMEEVNQEESNVEELNEESNLEELNQEELNVEAVNQEESNEEELHQEESNEVEPQEEELKVINSEINVEQHVEIDEISERDKAISLVRDWGFDNEEDTDDDTEDPDSRPSRPTMDF